MTVTWPTHPNHPTQHQRQPMIDFQVQNLKLRVFAWKTESNRPNSPPPLSNADPARSIEIQRDLNEILQDLAKFWMRFVEIQLVPMEIPLLLENICQDSAKSRWNLIEIQPFLTIDAAPSVSNKTKAVHPKQKWTKPWFLGDQTSCHPKWLSQFQVHHKPNLNQPLDSPTKK